MIEMKQIAVIEMETTLQRISHYQKPYFNEKAMHANTAISNMKDTAEQVFRLLV